MNRHIRTSRLAMIALGLAATTMIEAAGASEVGAPRAPVKYRVKEKSLIGNDLHEAGAVVSYAGLPSENLEPMCDEGRKRAAEYAESNRARISKMISDNKESAVGDPAKFAADFARVLAEERAEHAAQMSKMLALQQESATQLAEAAKNMATLAAALTQAQAAPAAPAEPVEKAAGKAKG
jgi:hypothetical protein